jgi:glycosyltransferase involved in cell wall biosynthesis
LRQSLGRAGREFVLKQFDWEIVAARYAHLLNELAAAPRTSSCECL